jgi:hypothetical protein
MSLEPRLVVPLASQDFRVGRFSGVVPMALFGSEDDEEVISDEPVPERR